MFVIATKFEQARPVIYECVEAIQFHHDDPLIAVIDSASSDKSYMSWCWDHGCTVADIDNLGYAHGAFAYAIRHWPNEAFYGLIFDSLIVQSNLDHLCSVPLTVTRHWSEADHDWGWNADGSHLSEWGGYQLENMGISMPTNYHGVMGPMLFVQRSVVAELDEIGYWDIPVSSAYEHCAMERVCGITLESLGHDIPSTSIQGLHHRHDSVYDERLIRKVDMARA